MRNCIGRIFEPLRRVLRPGQGRHRTVKASPPVICGDAPTLRLPRVRQVPVRPYVVANERRRGLPRVEVLCAPHGVVVVR